GTARRAAQTHGGRTPRLPRHVVARRGVPRLLRVDTRRGVPLRAGGGGRGRTGAAHRRDVFGIRVVAVPPADRRRRGGRPPRDAGGTPDARRPDHRPQPERGAPDRRVG